jgi:hypothetical protein
MGEPRGCKSRLWRDYPGDFNIIRGSRHLAVSGVPGQVGRVNNGPSLEVNRNKQGRMWVST